MSDDPGEHWTDQPIYKQYPQGLSFESLNLPHHSPCTFTLKVLQSHLNWKLAFFWYYDIRNNDLYYFTFLVLLQAQHFPLLAPTSSKYASFNPLYNYGFLNFLPNVMQKAVGFIYIYGVPELSHTGKYSAPISIFTSKNSISVESTLKR